MKRTKPSRDSQDGRGSSRSSQTRFSVLSFVSFSFLFYFYRRTTRLIDRNWPPSNARVTGKDAAIRGKLSSLNLWFFRFSITGTRNARSLLDRRVNLTEKVIQLSFLSVENAVAASSLRADFYVTI